MATDEDVATWMLQELQRKTMLDQGYAAFSIKKNFGAEFTYQNENGNLAISKSVLKVFRKLSGDDAVWERGDRAWRLRRPSDKPGRQQE